MSFPQTSPTLIERISAGGAERDWRQFLADYWGPICRFARRSGPLSWEDAEDVAAQTFEAILQNQLLARWVLKRSAKLRTLLCTVVRNVLSNRARVETGRARLLREHGGRLDDRGGLPVVAALDASAEQVDAFYAAWVEDLLGQAVDALMTQFHREGKGDHFRVLYGRLSDGMTLADIARDLNMPASQAENAYKQARQRLAQQLEGLVRDHVRRYCPEDEAKGEFAAEWSRLGEYLKEHGGLEDAVRRAQAGVYPSGPKKSKTLAMNAALTQMSQMRRPNF